MSELSNKIKALRGTLSAEEAGQKCGLSRESFYRIERGGSVKIETLREIARGFTLPETAWLDLLVAWLKQESGLDAGKLFIEPIEGGGELNDAEASQVTRAMMLFTNLNPHDRAEITKAMQRPEVRACLPAINSVWEKFGEATGRSGEISSARLEEIDRGLTDAVKRDAQTPPGK